MIRWWKYFASLILAWLVLGDLLLLMEVSRLTVVIILGVVLLLRVDVQHATNHCFLWLLLISIIAIHLLSVRHVVLLLHHELIVFLSLPLSPLGVLNSIDSPKLFVNHVLLAPVITSLELVSLELSFIKMGYRMSMIVCWDLEILLMERLHRLMSVVLWDLWVNMLFEILIKVWRLSKEQLSLLLLVVWGVGVLTHPLTSNSCRTIGQRIRFINC